MKQRPVLVLLVLLLWGGLSEVVAQAPTSQGLSPELHALVERVDAQATQEVAKEREHQGRGYKVPNGALYTTVEDLARFVSFEMGEENPAVLKEESLEESFQSMINASPDLKGGYGIGFEARRLDEVLLHGHSGGVAGYQALAYFDRGSRTGLIVLRNELGGPFKTSSLVRAAFGKVEPAPKP